MKKAITILMVLMLVFSIAACDSLPFSSNEPKKRTSRNKDDDDDDEDETKETKETTEVSETEPSETIDTEPSETIADPTTAPVSDNQFIDFEVSYYQDNEDVYLDEGYYSTYYRVADLRISPDCQYPNLVNLVDDIMDFRLQNYQDAYETNKEDVANDAADGFYYSISEDSDINMYRADDLMFSYCYNDYAYYGGAHGMYSLCGMNIVPSTGTLLGFTDIAKDYDGLRQLIVDELAEISAEYGLYDDYEDTVYNYFYDYGMDNNFIVTYTGIDVFFNPYELAPYASGIIRVSIPYEGNENYFNDDYWSGAPQNRVIPFEYYYDSDDGYDGGYKLDYDMDYDGNIDQMIIHVKYDEDYSIDLTLSVNGETSSFKDYWGYSIMPYLILKDGKTYILLDSLSDNDYKESYVYKIEDNQPTDYYVNDGSSSFIVDPDHFQINLRLYCIGTNQGSCFVKLDDNCQFKMLDPYYKIVNTKDIKTITDLEGTYYDSGDPVTVKSGSTVSYYGTDGESYALFKDENGELIKFEISTGYPETISGIEVDDCFEEGSIIYAG